MRALLDTHIVLWWLAGDQRLSGAHRALITDARNQLYVSTATVAEMSIKASLGKLRAPPDVASTLETEGFDPLPLTSAHAERLRELPWHHRDPFDRMLVAQASVEGLTLMTADARMRQYDIECA